MYNTVNTITPEEHPFETYIPRSANKLIIGTFPTEKSKREFDFFFPNRKNVFWKILSEIAGDKYKLNSGESELEAVENRKKILNQLNLGITDMGKKVYRQKNSSLDNSLFPIEFANIFKILDDYQGITKLFLTSSSGPNSVKGWLKSYFDLNTEIAKYPLSITGKNSKNGTFSFKGRPIDIIVLTSTSGAARFIRDDEKAIQYKTALI